MVTGSRRLLLVMICLVAVVGCSSTKREDSKQKRPTAPAATQQETVTLSWGVYTGEVKNSQPHGTGSVVTPDGKKYTGEFRNGSIWKGYFPASWSGIFTTNRSYVGYWDNGKPHGEGRMEWQQNGPAFSEGTVYIGAFVEGKMSGDGTLLMTDGQAYSGIFKDDKVWKGYLPASWSGIFTDNRTYLGDLDNGKPHGKGRMEWQDDDRFLKGTVYIGAFIEGKMSGDGTLYMPGGETYSGIFKDDKIWSGHFEYTWKYADQLKYIGNWSEGEPNGVGTMIWRDGKSYTGEWRNGKQHGEGEEIRSDGLSFVGTFQDGSILAGHGSAEFGWMGYRVLFTGQWAEGKPNGIGEARSPQTHAVLKGEWVDGLPHGSIETAVPSMPLFLMYDSQIIVGEYRHGKPWGGETLSMDSFGFYVGGRKEGLRHGFGVRYDSDTKDMYFGYWANGDPHGQGVLDTLSWTYEGGWKEGKLHGKGTVTYDSGRVVHVEHRDGVRIKP